MLFRSPPAVLLALYSLIAVPSLVRGFGLSLSLVLAKECMDDLLVGVMACHEVEQIPHHSWLAASELIDECFIGRARDERSDHDLVHDIRKLTALLGKAVDVLA